MRVHASRVHGFWDSVRARLFIRCWAWASVRITPAPPLFNHAFANALAACPRQGACADVAMLMLDRQLPASTLSVVKVVSADAPHDWLGCAGGKLGYKRQAAFSI